ncbi:BON domain-containing protein [Winogradskyella thalassocola]|uniref:Osmotically-inducible protein OsmY, contains BON domain n=1 Tax=Winogradskyella thalassocola TaxID=262004 RepID=A0A1G8JF74_9FLAO|nr:BON domain-containing protein [Winogradskyella thalassocola]SDI29667.1 Osmotically-inducible protein OsmY, contains BON domain [Winogradskyella thalassocola]
MRTDAQIKQDILDELAFQPNINETQIGVVVKDGIVTLTGLFFSYALKIAVVQIIEKIEGVKAIAEGIKIGYLSNLNKTDTEIANAAINAMEWNDSVPNDKVIVEVDNGWITLLGELEWAYQKDAVRQIAENLSGVKGVTNSITLNQFALQPEDIKEKITKAFKRSALVDALSITVETTRHAVKLTGNVQSVTEKKEAEKVAFNALGVYAVQNELRVDH